MSLVDGRNVILQDFDGNIFAGRLWELCGSSDHTFHKMSHFQVSGNTAQPPGAIF